MTSSHFRLLIFDMDDTLIASKDTWMQAETRLYRLLGQPYRPDIAEKYKGMNAWDVARVIHTELQPTQYTAEDCGRFLRENLLEEFQGRLTMMPGADDLVRRVAGHVDLAIASGSPLEVIQRVLTHCGWESYFRLLVSSEQVAHGKPEPDVFLETARQFGCAPEDCLVFEDSLNGVRAAKRADMTCFVVPSSDDPHIPEEADRSFASLGDITLEDIEGYRPAFIPASRSKKVLEILFQVCPSFQQVAETQRDDWDDGEGHLLLYIALSDFVRHLAQKLEQGDTDHFQAIFDEVERLILEGEPDIKEAMIVGFLEDLQNRNFYTTGDPEDFRRYLGKQSEQAWDELYAYWNEVFAAKRDGRIKSPICWEIVGMRLRDLLIEKYRSVRSLIDRKA